MTVDQPIKVVPYDAAWPARFEQERDALVPVLGDVAVGGLHHVGSTAVPGLAAKPTIDVLAGIRDLDVARDRFPLLARLEYHYAPYRQDEMHWFCKPSPKVRAFHLHLVPYGSRRYTQELAFRDFLRADRGAARGYEALKLRLASEFEYDREAYTDAKAQFIAAALQAASRI